MSYFNIGKKFFQKVTDICYLSINGNFLDIHYNKGKRPTVINIPLSDIEKIMQFKDKQDFGVSSIISYTKKMKL